MGFINALSKDENGNPVWTYLEAPDKETTIILPELNEDEHSEYYKKLCKMGLDVLTEQLTEDEQ